MQWVGWTERNSMEGTEQLEPEQCDENIDSLVSEPNLESTDLDSVATTSSKVNTCKICGKTFTRKARLTLHNLIHSGEKKFECEVCSKHFTNGSSLRRHMVVHTGERPYPCEVCGKDFQSKRDVKRHMDSHVGGKEFR